MEFYELIEKVNKIDQDFENFRREKSICLDFLKEYYWEINLRNASDNTKEFISRNKLMSPNLGISFSHYDARYLSDVNLKALKSDVTMDLFILIARIIGNKNHIDNEIEAFIKSSNNKLNNFKMK